MAVLQKIRGWGIWLSLIIAFALLLFILNDQTITSWLFNRNVYVGKIDGEKIKYEEFNEVLSAYQSVSGTSSKENPFELEDVAWNDMVMNHLFIPRANEAGIYVTDEEISEALAQQIQQQYGISLREYIDVINSGDDRFSQEKALFNLRSRQLKYALYAQKYAALFNGLDFDNSLVKQSNIALNSTVATSVDMIVVYPTASQSEIEVSADEIKARYNERLLNRTDRSRDVTYAVFHIAPSDEDIAQARKDFEAIDSVVLSDKNPEKFVVRNSEKKSVEYYRKGGLNAIDRQIEEAVFEAGENHTSVVYDSRNRQYTSAFVLESGMLSDTLKFKAFVFAPEEALMADSLFLDIQAGLSEEEVSEKYDVQAADFNLTRNQRAPFKDMFDAPLNQFKKEELPDGSVSVYAVNYKSAPELLKKVAILRKTVNPSTATEKAVKEEADRFYSLVSGGTNAFVESAGQVGKGIIYNANVNDRTLSYQGLNTADPSFDGRSMTRSIFSNDDKKDLTPGKVSEILHNGENYIIIACKSETAAGYPSLETLRPQLESEIRAEKAKEALVAETLEKVKGLNDLEAMAEALGTEVQNREVKYSDFVNPYYGATSQKFVGAVIAAENGKIYGPMDGGEFVYIFRVNSKETGAYYDDTTASRLDDQRRYMMSQSLLGIMSEDAGVENNVARYF